ncbi:MAG: AtpZ/AtpI family protein [Longibaculum sp.]
MLKDLLFALELGLRVIIAFILCLYIGFQMDAYFDSQPVCLLIGLLLAFVYVMKLLLGVAHHE